MILESDDHILPEHLPLEMSSKEVMIQNVKGIDIKIPPGGIDIEEVEKELIRQSLDMTRGNQTKAAKLLSLTRDTLRYRMQKFGFLPEKG